MREGIGETWEFGEGDGDGVYLKGERNEREKEVSIERPTQPLAKIESVLRVGQNFLVAGFTRAHSR